MPSGCTIASGEKLKFVRDSDVNKDHTHQHNALTCSH